MSGGTRHVRRRHLRVCALALACVLLSTGWSYHIVGDSITGLSREELTARDGRVHAFGGVDIPTGRQELRRLGRGRGPIVIALGQMDVSRRTPMPDLRRRIRNVLTQDVANVECVIWVDIKETSNVHLKWPERSRAFNELLAEMAARWNRPVARWSVLSASHPNWFKPDGIHPTRLGQARYAEFVTRAVQRFC